MIPRDIKYKIKLFRENWDTEILKRIISDNKTREDSLRNSYEIYKGNHKILQDVETSDEDNIYHREVIPYPNFIVKQVVGYLTGKSPTMQAIDERNTEKYMKLQNDIQFHEQNKEIVKFMSSTSEAFIYSYLTFDGKYGTEIVPPWQVIILENTRTETIIDAIRYYYIDFENDESTSKNKRLFVEYWYRDASGSVWVKHYLENEKGDLRRVKPELFDFSASNDILWINEFDNLGMPGNFGDYIPFVRFINNYEMQSDFEVVQTLIDGEDLISSDALRDLRRFANAIIKSINARISKDDIIDFKKQKLTVINIKNENGEIPADIEWLIKDLSKLYEFLEWIDKSHHKKILLFSHRFDPTDEDFRLSYESIQYIIMMLENQSSSKESELRRGWTRELKILSTVDNEINTEEITLKYYRNLPKETKYYMETIKTAVDAGYPLEVAIGNTPFANNIKEINELGEDNNG